MPIRLRFGRCEVRPDERVVLIDGRPAPLGARAFDVLLALIEHRDRVVGKAELLDMAWPGLVVEENNLSVQISALRRVLGAQAIATIPSRGYQFAQGVDEEPLSAAPQPVAPVADPVQATSDLLALVLRRDRVLLCARVGAAVDALSMAQFATDAAAFLADRGGRWLSRAERLLTAELPEARAAAACAARLHQLAQRPLAELGLGVGIVGAEASASLDLTAAERLATLARDGETLVSAALAGQLIPSLDGDLHDLGEQHLDGVPTPFRIHRLTPVGADGDLMSGPRGPDNLRPTVAVIPFVAYAKESDGMVLGDVIADQVIGVLSRSDSINVISRLSTLGFRDRDAPVAQIARLLGAHFVVSGRYWVAGGRVQVHVELADAASSRVLWTHTAADQELAVLHPDSQLVLELVAGISRAVFAHEVRSVRSMALPNLESHTLLLAAISLLYRLSPRDFDLARQALETLHERAPRHAGPLAWLARWHLFRVVQGWTDDREADGRQALDCANRAIDLDPDSSLALTMLGNVHTSFVKDLDLAEMYYDQALSINPNESLAWLQKGNARSFRGDGAAALEHVDRAVSLSPLDPLRHYYLSIQASAALSAGHWSRAIDSAQTSLRLNHEHVSTHRVLAIALAMAGRLDEARQSVRHVLRLEPRLTVAEFIARSPGARYGLAETFGKALHDAGLPLGPIELQ